MGYRKIIVNGETVVDFSDKVSNNDVIKGKYFYNQKGDIEEGSVDPSGQLLGTAKKFVITPGTTEFRVPHGFNYGEDYFGKQQFDRVFENVEELYIPKSLNTIYPDSFVCGYGEGLSDFSCYTEKLKKIHFEDLSSFINSKYVFWTEDLDEYGNYHNNYYGFHEDYYTLYTDYPCFGYNPWNLGINKPYAMLDKNGQQITYFKMPVINNGYLPPRFFTNLYIDTLELADGYTLIDDHAFTDCKIKRLILPSSLGYSNFMGYTSGIKEVIYSGPESDFGEGVYPIPSVEESIYSETTEQGFITLKDDLVTLQGYYGTDRNVVIPKNIIHIGNSCFYEYKGLETVNISDSVTSIGWSAFEGCTSLTSVVIPEGVTSIDDYAFAHCHSLTSVVIPNSVTTINDRAFYKSYGKKIDIYCTSATPPAIQSKTFNSSYINKIYVPTDAAVDAYKAASNWSDLGSKIVQGVKE